MEISREIVLPCPREEVWDALTDPERLQEWFATEVELDLEPGGEGIFRWGDGEERHGVVEEVTPEERLVIAWDDDGRVEFTLDEVEEGTRLTVVETQACAGEWSWGVGLWALTRSSARSAIPTVAA